MVLVTHKFQGSHVTFPLRSQLWSKGLILKRCITKVHVAERKEKHFTLRHNHSISIGAPSVGGLRAKPLRVSSFKGDAQNSNGVGRESGPKEVSNKSVKLSYLSDDDENNINVPSNSQNNSLAQDAVAVQPAVHNLFKKWLRMIRTQSPSHVVDKVLGEEPPQVEKLETQNQIEKTKTAEDTKAVWSKFWSLDATIKIPLLMFVPGFVAVSTIYGAEVTKELMPLWLFGPLIVALYVKMFRTLFALYVFCFKQTVQIIRNLPAYSQMVYSYVIQGRLKDDLRARLWQPVKTMDYKEVFRAKLKEFLEWITEKYLDFIESVWPYYCRTIKFLKRANLI